MLSIPRGISLLCLALASLAAQEVKIPSTLGARASGFGWRDSLATGALMNARGLMELIVMKIGLDAGLIGREMFTMLLLMALVTTAMTTPMISLFAGRRSGAALPAAGEAARS